MISRDSLKGHYQRYRCRSGHLPDLFYRRVQDHRLPVAAHHPSGDRARSGLHFPKKLQEGEREHPWLAGTGSGPDLRAFATAYFLASDIDYYMERIRYVDPVSDAETVCATAAVLLVLEATRRVAGLPLVIVASAFLTTALAGSICPASSGTTASPTKCSANSCIS